MTAPSPGTRPVPRGHPPVELCLSESARGVLPSAVSHPCPTTRTGTPRGRGHADGAEVGHRAAVHIPHRQRCIRRVQGEGGGACN